MAARRVTYNEYLEWMARRPRTNDWSALVAYDRDKCNHLLYQEYVEKFDSNSYMPPIDDTYATGETTWFWLNDYQTDAPRLSFENNPDGNGNVAEVNMSMAVVGGTEIEVFSTAGGAEVTKISSFDPLDHPELKAEKVSLKDVTGQVDQGGSVVLDLGDPTAQRHTWELSNSRIEHVRRVGGAYLKRKFREAEPARRTYKLGQLAYTEQQFLKPAKFKMRTVMEAGANVRSAANFGNGALELRIAMKGELEGGFPGEDWLYPFPSDRPELNASLMLNDSMLMMKVIGGSLAKAFGDSAATFDEIKSSVGFIDSIAVRQTTGGLQLLAETYRFSDNGMPGFGHYDAFSLAPVRVPMYSTPGARMVIEKLGNNNFRFSMGADSGIFGEALLYMTDQDGKQWTRPFQLELSSKLTATFLVGFDSDRGTINVEVTGSDAKLDILNSAEIPELVGLIKEYTSFQYLGAGSLIDSFSLALSSVFEPVDVFVLNSLLFNTTDAVNLKTCDVPGDLISFGSISPRLTTFAIDPAEKLLGYGATHTFTTNPVVAGVKWSVSNLDGSTAGAGQIDANTGRYTAPDLNQIGGTYKRVKIIATGAGSDGKPHVSKALVTVAARAITLNPLVQTCVASGEQLQTRQFSANSLDGKLKWSVIGDGSIPENANSDRSNLYTAPSKHDVGVTKRTFTIDEVKVINTATQQSQSSFVVVTHDIQRLVMAMKLEGANKAKFTATFNGDDPAPTWDLFPKTGAGTIDSSGLYTADPNSPSQFVIITARAVMGDFFLGDAFFIQPLPLTALPPKPKPEDPQASVDGMPQV